MKQHATVYLKVTFDDAGNVVRSEGNPILLDNSVAQDPGVLKDVEDGRKAWQITPLSTWEKPWSTSTEPSRSVDSGSATWET
ncbi:hypothetical protein ANANG_G00018040 [Anguilla anguilla]|uniref:Uncharacterized protein n=1 Tax=Anguilla anguilla TaxID=7936 RepID=A0A9D3MYM2_ANGAN|nr:hypothetical protein ANANG_G00018040 [Anguilla anguilla]